jgi:hypothetical protein
MAVVASWESARLRVLLLQTAHAQETSAQSALYLAPLIGLCSSSGVSICTLFSRVKQVT